jgi:hypothetical protein
MSLDLLPAEHNALRRVVAGGPAGLVLGQGVTPSEAIRLSLDGLVTITKGHPQRAVATAKGGAFCRRGAFA